MTDCTNHLYIHAERKKNPVERDQRSSSTASTSTRLSTTELQGIVDRLRLQKHRSSTKANYYTVWKIFSRFYLRLDIKPEQWEDRIILFIGYLINNKKQSSTVKSYLSAIRNILKDDGVELNENIFLVSSLTKACKFANDRARTRLPIQKSMLTVIINQVEKHFNKTNQPYLKLLYKTLFSTMYYRLLRISEVSQGPHMVLAKDIQVGTNKKKMLIILRSSKTHGEGAKPQLVKISSTSNVRDKANSSTCPYQLLLQFARSRGSYESDSEPFFVYSDRSPIKRNQLRSCLTLMIKKSGFDAKLYCSHSLRIGRSCDLLKYGLSVESIMKIGRWKSNAVFRYLRYYTK